MCFPVKGKSINLIFYCCESVPAYILQVISSFQDPRMCLTPFSFSFLQLIFSFLLLMPCYLLSLLLFSLKSKTRLNPVPLLDIIHFQSFQCYLLMSEVRVLGFTEEVKSRDKEKAKQQKERTIESEESHRGVLYFPIQRWINSDFSKSCQSPDTASALSSMGIGEWLGQGLRD